MKKEKIDINKYLATDRTSVIEAMQKIDINAKGILYLVDSNGKLSGSISDGDIRRWILKKGDLNALVKDCANKNVISAKAGDNNIADKLMQVHKISSIPFVDEENRVVSVKFKQIESDTDPGVSDVLSETPIIVMAGGRGTRLYPYTKILPKPLIPIGDIPILERILNHFYRFGAQKFYLTINYKKEMIKSYFYELKPDYEIIFVEEDIPLGTAGSIKFIKNTFEKPVMVSNCDILIEADYQELMEYHKTSGNDITIVSSLKNTVIPYGVLHAGEQGIINSMEEKPQLSYFINTGMYIVNPEFLEWIPGNRVFHMTDLAEMMLQAGKRVGMFPISENSFLDMGQFEEMKKMEERIGNGYVR